MEATADSRRVAYAATDTTAIPATATQRLAAPTAMPTATEKIT